MSGGGNFFTNNFRGNTDQGYYPIINPRLAHLEPLLEEVNLPNTRDYKDPLVHAKPLSDSTSKIPKEAKSQVQVTICQVGGGRSPNKSDPSQLSDSDNSSSDSEDNNFQVANLEEEKAEVEAAKAEAAEAEVEAEKVKEESTETKVKEESVNKRKKETLLSPVTKKKQKKNYRGLRLLDGLKNGRN